MVTSYLICHKTTLKRVNTRHSIKILFFFANGCREFYITLPFPKHESGYNKNKSMAHQYVSGTSRSPVHSCLHYCMDEDARLLFRWNVNKNHHHRMKNQPTALSHREIHPYTHSIVAYVTLLCFVFVVVPSYVLLCPPTRSQTYRLSSWLLSLSPVKALKW